ncbi:MAG: hypothetical protein VB070_05960 [Clostridiaceae bacterium]|nr:hypothetical protein [Clostridiaceae bacterium]
MQLNFTECADAVFVKSYPEYFPSLYDDCAADGSLDSTLIAEETYIRSISGRYGLFTRQLEPVLAGARALLKNKPLLRYANLLGRAMSDRGRFLQTADKVAIPWKGEPDPAFDFASLLAMLPMMDDTAALLRAHHLPERYIRGVFREFEACVNIFELRFGRPAVDQTYFGWLQHFIDATIIRFGELNFERRYFPSYAVALKNKTTDETAVLPYNARMHREGMILGSAGYTDDGGAYDAAFTESDAFYAGFPCDGMGFCSGKPACYPKSEWVTALMPGDPVLSIHIPRGAKLGGNAGDDSYAEALEVLGCCFPEFQPKAMICCSWLMDKRIDAICGGAPNIVNFQKPYHTFPLLSAGKEIFSFVFIKPFERFEDLPEDTRLMRALKKRCLDGGCIHAFGGLFLLRARGDV